MFAVSMKALSLHVSVNKEGGNYCRGRQYGVEKKLAVAACYEYNK